MCNLGKKIVANFSDIIKFSYITGSHRYQQFLMLPDQIHQQKKIANICDFGTVKYKFQSHRYLQSFEMIVNICDLGTDR